MGRLPNQTMQPGTPDRPRGLSAEAVLEWDRFVDELQSAGILITRAHRAILEAASTTSADLAAARETMELEGAYVTNEKTGAIQAHPATRRVDSLRRDLIKALSLLGLRTPVAEGQSEGETLEDVLND